MGVAGRRSRLRSLLDTAPRRSASLGACAGSRARSGASRGWSRRTTICIDVVTQLNAARAALESVALLLLQEHTKHCVAEAITAGDPGPKVRELSEAIERMVRS